MNHIGIQYWPMRLQPSDYCEITISCQVCWRMRRWHNGRTRRSPNPKSEIVLRDCSVNGEESAAHSILARSDPLQQRPYTFAQSNLWRLHISLAARRRTIHSDNATLAELARRWQADQRREADLLLGALACFRTHKSHGSFTECSCSFTGARGYQSAVNSPSPLFFSIKRNCPPEL